jgi:hypothetical protein
MQLTIANRLRFWQNEAKLCRSFNGSREGGTTFAARRSRVAGLVLRSGLRPRASWVLIVTAVAAAMLLDPHASQGYERPWCALTDIGGGVMHENCTLPTFEMCVQEVIAGNRRAGRPPRRRPGSRAASGSASTTERRIRSRPGHSAASGTYCRARRLWAPACARGQFRRCVVSMHAQPGDRVPRRL